MSTANTDERNLALQEAGGLVHEDLMDKIFDIDPVDLPFTDAIGQRTSTNHYSEWVSEVLEAATPDNATIDGADAVGNDAVLGNRFGNYHQLADKTVRVSDRGRNSDTVGSSDELVRQLSRRQKGLRRDVEASLASDNPAVAGDGTSAASKCAGIGAWIITNNVPANTGFVHGGLSGTTGGFPDAANTPGTKGAGSETAVRAAMRLAYMEGGDPTMAMSTPPVIEAFSSYLFTSSARVATLQSNAPQGNRTGSGAGNGNTGGGVVAQGSVNLFVTDYGTLELVPNRFQPDVIADEAADLYLVDPDYWEVGYLQGYQSRELARTGTAENRQITVDYTLCALNERSSSAVRTIDTALSFTA